ncbi:MULTISPECIES: DNA gyrase subunit A [Methanohalophilus]|uniref:DNA gyrase subunit A n=1 Tax=Methanohalophilus euhalobius TaxID=51203 RepID=A0A285ENY8_9EURY|nr:MULTISPECIES: DNA gyrase subunit A [Methanohalophilus]ODV49495.1 MAG: DNA gyrase subunit A [Methanohalophilus sp. 2-GBenrich]PQV42660.1 DNA gyrase subunit A [Methanohalophilus euhalobius]RNI08687.1 DNA gyrase subunit A [Methanohalophilus euhalobius]RXG35113.1 DNA gyrase subunit A [Methanohalophilus sp. WG1-DM]TCL11248.1 DNA gyrase subunit A [Methanohalophilus euhalobius]
MADDNDINPLDKSIEQHDGEGGRVVPVLIQDEMKRSYIDYSMSVIVGRALPDARDGLKPVHRRILHSMNEAGITHDKAYKKSARVVGDVLGKFHPHGDTAVYDSLVRMVQDFSLRYPLIDGQGNFGSVDGDSAAAMRYTEVRMDKITTEMLEDIKKGTVDFKPNYDGSLEEPEVLPSKLPNLLLNGSTGIAVGMATNMAPHNLREVVDATVKLIDDPDTELSELLKIVKGPDFPTGGIIMGTSGIKSAYETGRSPIHLRAVTEIEEMKNDKYRIVVYELPYQVNKARLVESIANLVRDKKIEGISDLRDESGREGLRVVIELKKGANPKVLLNQLYKQTQLETTFGIINLALVDGVPRVLNLRELIQIYLKHRIDVITRRTAFDLRKAEERAHILQGLKIALDNIDEVIKLIRGSATTEEAREGLISNFNLDETQAKAILDMRLQRLTGLEREKIDEEYNGLIDMIADLKDILANDERKYAIIKDEVLELKDKYGDERRTLIQGSREELADEDLIPEEEVVVTSTQSGYIKNIPLQTYNMQHRGGRGVRGMETKEDDTVGSIFVASTHDYILFFTNHGKVYWQKVYDIPRGSRQSRGKAIVNLLELAEGESVNAMIPVHDFEKDRYLFMGTRDGTVKRCSLSDFSNPRRAGIIAISLKEGDELVNVLQTDGNQDIMLASRHGKALRISEEDVRVMGRTARGVRGMKLTGADVIVSLDVVDSDATLLTVTENGFGKRTPFDEYRTLRRGGQGVITIFTDMRNGPVVTVKTVEDDDEIILTSSAGIVIRIPVTDIRVQGRNTKGVKIMNIREKDKLVSLARIKKEE